jgi:hypothetical protein
MAVGTTSASVVGRAAVGTMVETSRHMGVGEVGGGEVGMQGVTMAEVTIGGCLTLGGQGEEEGRVHRLGRLGVGTRHRIGGNHFD